MLPHLRRLFRYEWWANREVAAALEAPAEPPERPLQLFAHLVATQRLWLERVLGAPQSMPVWPSLSVAQCRAQLEDLEARWREQLGALSEVDLASPVRYTNTRGETYTNRVGDILTHVILHSAYHRGQVATALRGAGLAPPYTDYIHAVRQGFVTDAEGDA